MLGHFAHVDTSGIKTLTVDYSGGHSGHLMEVKVRDKETESVKRRFGLLIPSAKREKENQAHAFNAISISNTDTHSRSLL